MTKEATEVKKFMELFGQSCPDKPTKLDKKTAELRAKLVFEECLELINKGLGVRIYIQDPSGSMLLDTDNKYVSIDFEQVRETDLNQLADGVSDSMVVCEGTAIAAGIDSEPIHAIVNASNLSKMWKAGELSQAPTTATIEKMGEDLYRVKREDGKVLKSPSYVNAVPLIEAEIERQKNAF